MMIPGGNLFKLFLKSQLTVAAADCRRGKMIVDELIKIIDSPCYCLGFI